MTFFNIGLVAIVHLSLFLSTFSWAAPSVDLGYAQYEGAVDTSKSITNFLGIRYATAPVGNLRWAAPQPPPAVCGVQQATSEPNECYQSGLGGSSTNPLKSAKRDVTQSEDCLFLNVHVPGTTVNSVTSGGLPVVVWIHGGGYGGLSVRGYDGANLVFQSQNSVIAVVIQYRLGLFGFLPGAAVKSGGALNAGLLDQTFALSWVQKYIFKFGGDPSRVTIWGQSAGAGSVLQHIVANGGNTQPSLFKAAITSSVYLPPQYNYNDPIPELLYSQAVSGAGCSSSSDTLSCLRNTDAGILSNVSRHIQSNGFHGTAILVPVVDGTMIIERPTVTLGKGNHNGEVLYSVTNSFEGSQFVQKSLNISVSQYISSLFPDIQSSQAESLGALYESLGTNLEQAQAVMGESIFVCPTYFLVKAFGQNAWKGEYAAPPATHGSDIGRYFTFSTSQFVTAFSNSFLATVKSQNPGDTYQSGDILPLPWNGWADDSTEMIFNATSSGSPNVFRSTTNIDLLHRCAAWLNVTANTSQ